ncbi:hypothetical protein KCV01_g25131, partial [Aureobasidium melanogenum]
LRERLAGARWEDGRSTAGYRSAEAKRNEQVPEDDPTARALGDILTERLLAHPTFFSAAIPLRIYPPLFNRYQGGQSFGMHVDNAVRYDRRVSPPVAVRTDISATLFLSEPDDYDGGELVVEDTYGVHEVKLPAGHLVLYPASSLHRQRRSGHPAPPHGDLPQPVARVVPDVTGFDTDLFAQRRVEGDAAAFDYVMSLAKTGDAAAQTIAGQMLLDGQGCGSQPAEAVYWFMHAAHQHSPMAMNMLGRCHENGWGTEVDQPLAAVWFRRAAEHGLDWGMYNYAHVLERGRGVAADRGKAFH